MTPEGVELRKTGNIIKYVIDKCSIAVADAPCGGASLDRLPAVFLLEGAVDGVLVPLDVVVKVEEILLLDEAVEVRPHGVEERFVEITRVQHVLPRVPGEQPDLVGNRQGTSDRVVGDLCTLRWLERLGVRRLRLP